MDLKFIFNRRKRAAYMSGKKTVIELIDARFNESITPKSIRFIDVFRWQLESISGESCEARDAARLQLAIFVENLEIFVDNARDEVNVSLLPLKRTIECANVWSYMVEYIEYKIDSIVCPMIDESESLFDQFLSDRTK